MAEIKKIALKLGQDGPHKTFPTARRVQILFNNTYVIKTTNATFVWEHPYYPQLYISKAALSNGTQHPSLEVAEGDPIHSSSGALIATQLTLKLGNRSTDECVRFSDDLTGPAEALRGLVKIEFGAMDQWFEEDTPIFVHPKDPFKRIDILTSTRRVKVSIDGEVVAETTTAMHLYETGLPCRYYMPLTAIKPDILRPSKLRTQCPYKGEAEYYSAEVNGKLHENVIWYYNRPTLECGKIEGLCCFYNEKVDIELDGEKLEQPKTPFSKAKPEKPSALSS